MNGPTKTAGWVRRALPVFLLTTALAACSDEEILEGERIPVRSADEIAVVGTSAGPALSPAVANADWPQRGGNSGRSGFHPAFEGEREVIWRYSAPAGVSGDWPYSAEPLVADGIVYLLDGRNELHAVDTENGRERWSLSLVPEGESGLDGVGGGMAYESGRLFATTSYSEVLALNAEDGTVLWRRGMPAPVHSAPVVVGAQVAVLARNNRLSVLDADTGEPVWDAVGPSAETVYLEAPAPAVEAGVLVAPFASGELGAYGLGGGESLWRRFLASGDEDSPLALFRDLTSDPVIYGDLVFAGTRRGEFSAFLRDSGEIAWQLPVGSPKPAWAIDGSVFMIDSNTRLNRIDARDGGVLWRRQLQAFEDPDDLEDPIQYTAPVLAGGHLLLGSTDGRLLAVDAASGELAFEHPLDDGMRASPVVAGGVAYLFLEDGTLIAMR